ncbi:MAG: GAF domain-containing protein, partial [Pseudobdellovibrionaceae bacterium]
MPESKIENLATPGSIQPHGFLVVLHPLDFKILQVSANIETLFSAPPEKCLGEPISAFMPEKDFILLRDFVETHTLNVPMTLELKRSSADQADQFDTWIFHRTSQGVITEVEPRVTSQLNNPRLYNAIREISALVPNSSLRTICDATADQIRTLTGFERILVYEYDSRYNSTIIAESIFAGAKSNIGLRFPATPMTNQLQKLYTKNTVRMMPSLSAVSIPILPAVSPVNNQPLDLTFSALRGVSNYHKESMEGMNVEASLAFALVMDGHIWGFLGCYHSRQHFVSYDVRVACEFMVHLLSTHIEYFKKAQAISEDAKRKAALVEIERLLSHKNNTPQEFAKKNLHLFINLVHATGVVYVSDSEFECCKMTPGLEVSSS